MRHRSLSIAAAALALAAPLLATAPAEAATTFSQVSLSATVNGTSVIAKTTVKASSQTTVQQFGVCARSATGSIVDFSPKQAGAVITTSGTSLTTSARTYAPGTYRYYACVLSNDKWSSVGTAQYFTVAAPPKVIFSDDFSGASGANYDHSKWGEWSTSTYNGSAAYGNIKPGDRAKLDGQGHLSIPATPTQGTSISTKDTFGFVYGTVTIRAKVSSVPGYWPGLWTLNNNPDGHDTLPLGEMDVHESYTGLSPDSYHHGTHNWNNDLTWGSKGDYLYGVDHVLDEWHDYGAKIEPGKITFYFDGVQSGDPVLKSDGDGKPYGFGPDVTRPNWVILTNAVGGAGGQQDGKAVAPSSLLIDRVEVRAL